MPLNAPCGYIEVLDYCSGNQPRIGRQIVHRCLSAAESYIPSNIYLLRIAKVNTAMNAGGSICLYTRFFADGALALMLALLLS